MCGTFVTVILISKKNYAMKLEPPKDLRNVVNSDTIH